MDPIVDGIEANFKTQIVVKRVNALEGDGPAIMRSYRIPGHPATLIFDASGQETQRFVGPQTAQTLEQAIQAALNR